MAIKGMVTDNHANILANNHMMALEIPPGFEYRGILVNDNCGEGWLSVIPDHG